MASHKKGKGGKPIAGASVSDIAEAAQAKALAEYQASPDSFIVFTVIEDLWKKGDTEHLIKGMRSDGTGVPVNLIVVKELLNKEGKLIFREMGLAGTRLIVQIEDVKRERLDWAPSAVAGRVQVKRTVIEKDYKVRGMLP
jgi:hypothetical protein